MDPLPELYFNHELMELLKNITGYSPYQGQPDLGSATLNTPNPEPIVEQLYEHSFQVEEIKPNFDRLIQSQPIPAHPPLLCSKKEPDPVVFADKQRKPFNFGNFPAPRDSTSISINNGFPSNQVSVIKFAQASSTAVVTGHPETASRHHSAYADLPGASHWPQAPLKVPEPPASFVLPTRISGETPTILTSEDRKLRGSNPHLDLHASMEIAGMTFQKQQDEANIQMNEMWNEWGLNFPPPLVTATARTHLEDHAASIGVKRNALQCQTEILIDPDVCEATIGQTTVPTPITVDNTQGSTIPYFSDPVIMRLSQKSSKKPGPKPSTQYKRVREEEKDERYWNNRTRNTASTRRSRELKRSRTQAMLDKVKALQVENDELTSLVKNAKLENQLYKKQLEISKLFNGV